MANYVPYMMNPMNYNVMPLYNNQMMQNNGIGQFNSPMMQPSNQLQQVNQMQQVQVPKQDFVGAFINNFDEVKGYPVPIDGTVILMEKSSNKFYIKTMDNNGNPLINTYVFQDSSIENNSNNDNKINKKQSDLDIFKDNVAKAMREVDTRLKDLEGKVNKNDVKGVNK